MLGRGGDHSGTFPSIGFRTEDQRGGCEVSAKVLVVGPVLVGHPPRTPASSNNDDLRTHFAAINGMMQKEEKSLNYVFFLKNGRSSEPP